MHAETALSCASELPAGLASHAALACNAAGAAEHLAFAGRVLAFTYDDHGHCDGFVLELGGNREHCFECREPAIQAILSRAFVRRRPMTILAAAAAPRRPLAILPGEA